MLNLKLSVDREDGLSLVESLVAVAILGLAFVSILAALTTTISGSELHRRQATLEAVLRNKAELVKSVSYQSCGTSAQYESATPYTPAAPNSQYSVSVTAVDYFSVSGSSPAPDSGCPVLDPGLQRLTLRAASPDGNVVKSLKVFKRP